MQSAVPQKIWLFHIWDSLPLLEKLIWIFFLGNSLALLTVIELLLLKK